MLVQTVSPSHLLHWGLSSHSAWSSVTWTSTLSPPSSVMSPSVESFLWPGTRDHPQPRSGSAGVDTTLFLSVIIQLMRWFNQRKLKTLEKQTEITLIIASSSLSLEGSVTGLSQPFCAALFHQSACRLFMFRDLLLWIIYGKIVTSVICEGKKWHDKWSDIKGCIDNGQKTFFNWITNILILCYPSKQALTLSISSVKLTIDRSVWVCYPQLTSLFCWKFHGIHENIEPQLPRIFELCVRVYRDNVTQGPENI